MSDNIIYIEDFNQIYNNQAHEAIEKNYIDNKLWNLFIDICDSNSTSVERMKIMNSYNKIESMYKEAELFMDFFEIRDNNEELFPEKLFVEYIKFKYRK